MRLGIVAGAVAVAVLAGGWGLAPWPVVAAEPGASPALAADAGCPKPEKDNSFAHDTWMRRHKYPLEIVLIETEGKGGENVPMTLSVACGEGDYPAGQLTPVLDGKSLAAQVDVLATWPSDKSIKHALVSTVLPAIGPKQRLVLTFKKETPAAPAKFKTAVDLKDFTARTEFESLKGEKTTSAVPAETMAKIAQALDGKPPAEEARKLAPRMCGPLCYEFEVLAPAETAGKPDPDIDVYYYLRFYSGQKAVRVAYVVEHSRIPKKPYPDKLVKQDRFFGKLSFQAGPTAKVETLYEQGATTHWWATRYQILRWWGQQPPAIYTKENPGYLMYGQFFPKLDVAHPLTAKQIENVLAHVMRPPFWKKNGQPWYSDPVKHPDGLPLDTNTVYPGMPATGGRPDIGAMPLWYRYALAGESPMLEYWARAADGNGLAAFPVHWRPAENRQSGADWKFPFRHLAYWNHGVQMAEGGTKCDNHPDSGHVPCTSYYTYLATGEKFYEEEMAFWASAMLWGPGYLPKHDRYGGWPLRNATDAAFILSDSHPMKQYFHDFVRRTVDYMVKLVNGPTDKYWEPASCDNGSHDYPFGGATYLWQHTIFLSALENASRKGFYPAAAEARDRAADLLLRLCVAEEEFKAPNGKTYRSLPQAAIPYFTATTVRRLDYTDPKKVKVLSSRDITGNSAEVFYYTMLEQQYERFKEKGRLAEMVPKGKTIVDPEDWRLDPEFEKEVCGKFVKGFWPGYHEEHNGSVSAALARYDNPRAQKMYELVRGWIADHYGPNRPMGIEYAK